MESSTRVIVFKLFSTAIEKILSGPFSWQLLGSFRVRILFPSEQLDLNRAIYNTPVQSQVKSVLCSADNLRNISSRKSARSQPEIH